MVIQSIVFFTILATVAANGFETNHINDTTNSTNKTGRYESSGDKSTVVVNNAVCFAGDTQVQLINGTWKNIGELKAGDLVHGYDGFKLVETEMIMMLHRQISINTAFHTLKTASRHAVSLTSLHLIAIVSSDGIPIYKPAKDVQIGDQLLVLSDNSLLLSPIVEITTEVKMGYYSPLFTKGVFFANGVLSSCYANVKNHDDAHFYMSLLTWPYYISRLFSINDLYGTSSTDGFHWIPRLMFTFGQNFRPSTLLV